MFSTFYVQTCNLNLADGILFLCLKPMQLLWSFISCMKLWMFIFVSFYKCFFSAESQVLIPVYIANQDKNMVIHKIYLWPSICLQFPFLVEIEEVGCFVHVWRSCQDQLWSSLLPICWSYPFFFVNMLKLSLKYLVPHALAYVKLVLLFLFMPKSRSL